MLYGLEFVETANKVYEDAKGKDFKSPVAVCELMSPIFENLKQEQLWVLLLNTKMNLIGLHLATIGLVDRTYVHPREVFRCAIPEMASNIIIVHNHPTGNLEPSIQDINVYNSIKSAGEIIGIHLIDHIIIGKDKNFCSIREKNL